MKRVPIFDEDVFKTVTTIESLWQKLSAFWTLLDYDLLIFVIELIDCKDASDVPNEFLSKIDVSKLEDVELILCCKEYAVEGTKPLLRIKLAINEETADIRVQQKVKEIVCKKFHLEKYALNFRTIKEGCIELLYQISNPAKQHMLEFIFTGYSMTKFIAENIVSIQIDDKELHVPSSVTNLVSILKSNEK